MYPHTYVFPSVRIFMLFFGGFFVGLAFLKEECLLKVFTADSYFMRRVGCRNLRVLRWDVVKK